MEIALIDSPVANIANIARALRHAGADLRVTRDAAVIAEARVRGFRIRTKPIYSGKPLRIGNDEGELRLFHRRYFLRRGDIAVQGTVVRLLNSFEATTFTSPREHRDYLAKTGVPHSGLRHVLLFMRYAMSAHTLDANTLHYLWLEAGFDLH